MKTVVSLASESNRRLQVDRLTKISSDASQSDEVAESSERKTYMRVLHIEYSIGFGGSIVSLAELIRGMSSQGVVSTVFTFQPESVTRGHLSEEQLVRRKSFLNYRTRAAWKDCLRRWKVSNVLFRLGTLAYALLDWFEELRLSIEIFRTARKLGIELIHVNNGWALGPLRAARWANIPVVVHFRGFPPITSVLEQRVIARYQSTVALCVGISAPISAAIAQFGIPSEKIVTIHNPISLRPSDDELKRQEIRRRYAVGADDVLVSVFGRVTPWKGQLEFLQAVEMLAAECPRLLVMIVGDESDSIDASYIQRVRLKAGTGRLNGRVIFAGFQRDVPAYYEASDIVVHCSIEAEPFGRVVIEGMERARAVIAMDEGGPPEIISPEIDGLLVPPRSPQQLAGAIRRLYEDEEMRTRLGRNARRTVQERFSVKEIAQKTLIRLDQAVVWHAGRQRVTDK